MEGHSPYIILNQYDDIRVGFWSYMLFPKGVEKEIKANW